MIERHCEDARVVRRPIERDRGARLEFLRYACMSSRPDPDGTCCVRANGLQTDEIVGEEILRCLAPLGIEAAVAALQTQQDAEDDRIKQKSLAVEQARYEAVRAQRQYDAVDATNRLVAAELERRWNAALRAQLDLEEDLEALRKERPAALGEAHGRAELTLDETAAMLKVNATTVMKWIRAGRLPATQLCPHAPWVLRQSDVERFSASSAQTAASRVANAEQLVLKIQ